MVEKTPLPSSPPPPTNVQVMTPPRVLNSLFFLALFVSVAAAATNFTQCLIDFQNSNATEGGTDYHGTPVSNPKDAVALTYKTCTKRCGSGQEAFDWSVFSQQFSAWLLPWLALVSQLPFGAESRLDNLISGVFPSPAHPCIPTTSLTPCTSRPHRWVSYPCSILARHDRDERPLGLRSVLRYQVPQPWKRSQDPYIPPTGPTTYNHPWRAPRVPYSPPRERRLVGMPRR